MDQFLKITGGFMQQKQNKDECLELGQICQSKKYIPKKTQLETADSKFCIE